tara:strand:- start:182 stop:367 length:186 start_codon:yes stop_codon:yes gene_type:complete
MFHGVSIVVFGTGGVGLTALLETQIMNATKLIDVDSNGSNLGSNKNRDAKTILASLFLNHI